MCAENTSISTEKNAYRWKDIFDLIDAKFLDKGL